MDLSEDLQLHGVFQPTQVKVPKPPSVPYGPVPRFHSWSRPSLRTRLRRGDSELAGPRRGKRDRLVRHSLHPQPVDQRNVVGSRNDQRTDLDWDPAPEVSNPHSAPTVLLDVSLTDPILSSRGPNVGHDEARSCV